MKKIKKLIESNWNNKKDWKKQEIKNIVLEAIYHLDQGNIRVASFDETKNIWKVHKWIKKAILMFFYIQNMQELKIGELEFYDKIPLKNDFKRKNIRVVPPAIARYGSYIAPGVILMPSYVNIGAYISENTMIDTWATVGSCAQIGSFVHVSGGVGIGGVLEPIQSNPVIIENNVFIGSRSIIVEGIVIEKESVLGANVVITSSTKIFDVSTNKCIQIKGKIPSRSVVIPGSYSKKFPSGKFNIPCALIIGKRKKSTDKKTSLNNALRDYNIQI